MIQRLKLEVPLHLYLSADDPSLLSPSLTFNHEDSKVQLRLDGSAPFRGIVPDDPEPDLRTISRCEIEISTQDERNFLSKLIAAHDHKGIVEFVMPIVNRALLAIRNFGWVTTAKKYRPEPQPEALLRAWRAETLVGEEWSQLCPKPKKDPINALFGFDELEENIERSSLSAKRWIDIEQALVEELKPTPEQEFLTNALQHLRDDNFRLALVEATVCLEIVLSQCLNLHLEVNRHFPKKKAQRVSNIGLTSKVGLVLDLILTTEERRTAELDSVLKAIGWRNRIIHDTGHLPISVTDSEVKECVYAMLNLALRLGERRDRLRIEPEIKKLASALATDLKSPTPIIEVSKYHKVKATFSYFSASPSYLRPLGMPPSPATPIPDEDAMREIIADLGVKFRSRDPWFRELQHLSVFFQHYPDRVFASFENGEFKKDYPEAPVPIRRRSILEG